MKHTLRIPTEMYSFIETEFEGTSEEAIAEYHRMTSMAKAVGVDTKVFNSILDEYLETGKVQNGGDLWEKLNPYQQAVFQEIKKSIKRRVAKI